MTSPHPHDHNGPPGEDYDDANPGNWIALSRRVREHPIVGCGQPVKPADPWKGAHSRFEAWFDLLCLAQYRPSRINNKGEVMTLEVGQLMGALPFLAERWNWTVKTVRGFLSSLEHERMIVGSSSLNEKTGSPEGRQQPNKCRVITICNYTKYQQMSDAIDQYIRQAKGQAGGSQWAGGGQAQGSNLTLSITSTKEQDHTLSEPGSDADVSVSARPKLGKRAYPEAFELFWRQYPDTRNNSKAKAFAEWRKLDATDRDLAFKALPGLARYCLENKDYRCVHAERFIRDRRFDGYALTTTSPDGSASAAVVWWRDPEKVAAITDGQWRGSIAKHANGVWPPDKLGPAPGSPRCVVPKHIIAELKLTEKYDANGISKIPH